MSVDLRGFNEADLDVLEWVAMQRRSMRASKQPKHGSWVCMTCGAAIKNPEDGWVEWFNQPDGWLVGFRLVCRAKCVTNRKMPSEEGHHLDRFLTEDGKAMFFDYIANEGKNVHAYEIWRLACAIYAPRK